MRTWQVIVQDQYGITAIHYVDAIWPSTAREKEEDRGYHVLQVSPHKEEHHFHTSA